MQQARFKPTNVKAPHGGKELEVTWADGHKSRLTNELLRGYCPCAGCQGHSSGLKFQTGGNTELREIEQVGNYALSFTWGDGHSSGIYSFRYLRSLGDLVDEQGTAQVIAMGELQRV
ncbi:MAG TPA: DUF971 domain-containing protein [Polyangiaceae bacterium]|nr:DUF971 domain-containing protein [Polyangiaceae bacterium]